MLHDSNSIPQLSYIILLGGMDDEKALAHIVERLAERNPPPQRQPD